MSGSIVTLNEITDRKKIAQELKKKNTLINKNRKALQGALDEVSTLIKKVATEKKFGVYFSLPQNLGKCWEKMKCETKSCPCYGKDPMRCWQMAGTFCEGEVQGQFAKKHGDCGQCPFYQEAISDPIYRIGEQFNNMMAILESKSKELEKAYEELKASQSQLLQHEKMASIGQLAAGVAHEINNPVGFVTSNLGTLNKYVKRLGEYSKTIADQIDGPDNKVTEENLTALRKKLKIDFVLEDSIDLITESLEGVDRVKKIVLNLKNFSRVDQSQFIEADINQCLEDTLNIVWNELKYKTTLRKEYDELPLTKCYPQQLNQVFMNLLVNAAQAIEKQGIITIRTWSADNNIYVSITDTGYGIPKENLNRLFEPFFTTKEVGKGTGLGLSIAYDIITKKHNGDITVESEISKGTTFTVKIPVIEEKQHGN